MIRKENSKNFWNCNKNKWLYFFSSPIEKQETLDLSTEQKIYIQEKKSLSKGSIVYTVDGFGVVQDIESVSKDKRYIEEEDEFAKFFVKVKDLTKEYNFTQIFSKIRVNLKVILNNTFFNASVLLPTTFTGKDILNKIEEDLKGSLQVNKEKPLVGFEIFYKGKKIEKSDYSKGLTELAIENDAKLLITVKSGYNKIVLRRYDPNNIYEYWEIYNNNKDALSFEASQDCIILGVGVFNVDQYQKSNGYPLNQFEVTVSLYEGRDTTNNLLTEGKLFLDYIEQTSLPNPEKQLVTELMFENPVRVTKDEVYTFVLNCVSTGCFYYLEGGKYEEEKDGVRFKFSYSNLSSTGTCPNYGQFPEIYFAVVK